LFSYIVAAVLLAEETEVAGENLLQAKKLTNFIA
jgi:hypothetical protein